MIRSESYRNIKLDERDYDNNINEDNDEKLYWHENIYLLINWKSCTYQKELY